MIRQYILLSILIPVLIVFLILLKLSGAAPLALASFGILVGLTFLGALYEPRWMWWLFMASLPLEGIILSPALMPISLRPYQLFGLILLASTAILWIFGRTNLVWLCAAPLRSSKEDLNACEKEVSKKSWWFHWLDGALFIFIFLAFIAANFSEHSQVAFKQAVVLVSFGALYWLGRNYVVSLSSLAETIWFFLLGALPVIIFSIFQAVAHRLGQNDFMVMDGRVNGTFAEPDWLGLYLTFLIAITLWLRFLLTKKAITTKIAGFKVKTFGNLLIAFFLFTLFFVLILTVARSAWLGAVAVIFIYLLIIFTEDFFISAKWNFKQAFKRTFFDGLQLGLIGIFCLLAVLASGLSSFHFANRASSSFTGLQKITISCQKEITLPEKISDLQELTAYQCRHINLQEIETEKSQNKIVKEIYRPDPNINIRKNIYLTVWSKIKERPIMGHGLGTAKFDLGADENGSGLNASNIFLEVFYSMGLAGLMLFLVIFFAPAIFAKWILLKEKENENRRFLAVGILLSTTALVIPNLFNAGLFLGIFWLWLAIVVGIFSSFK